MTKMKDKSSLDDRKMKTLPTLAASFLQKNQIGTVEFSGLLSFFLPFFLHACRLHTCDLRDKCQSGGGFIGRASAFHSLIAEVLRQIDYAAG